MSGILISGDTRGGVGGPARGGGQAAGGKINQAALKQAVGGVIGKLQQAWNKGDAKGVASVFGEQADYVTQAGGLISGRAKIEEAHKAILAGKPQAAYRVIKMKPLTNDIVVVFLGQQITGKPDPADKDAKGGVVRTRPMAVMRRVGNEFKIVAFQVTRAAQAAAPRAGGGGAGGAKKAAPAKASAKTAAAKDTAKKK